jgi:Ca2+-binding RTX toxin-like protein
MQRHINKRTLRFEQMEDRRMKSVSPQMGAIIAANELVKAPTAPSIASSTIASSATIGATGSNATSPITTVNKAPIFPMAKGSVWLDASGTVYVQGTDATNDTVTISIDTKGTSSTADDMVKVVLSNVGLPVTYEFALASVKQLNVQTFAGDDYIDNQTSIPMFADGGAGNDVILGGTGSDLLFGGAGAGNDYIDGRAGNDTLIAGVGTDMLFGDDGNDSLYGAAGGQADMFGGNGNDSLYAEGSNGFAFGGAGTDTLIDYTGTNKLYQDYGPNEGVIDQPENFDWFDRNLTDPNLRSLVRLEYRDMLFDRSDALNLFNEVAQDGTVSATEFSDLQKLAGTILQKPDYVDYLFARVVDGDPANAHYVGAPLGNLKAGSSATQLNELVDKWFEGTDLPGADSSAIYEQVSGSLFMNGVSYSDIDQGSVDDCYYMAALGEVALHSPQTITNMFITNGDGTYTVRFYNGSSEAFVTVNGELPVEGSGTAEYAGWGFTDTTSVVKNQFNNAGNELWVALAEKAYAQLNESGWIGQDGTNSYLGIGIGAASTAYSQITGKSASETAISSPSSSLTTTLASIFNSGKALMLLSKDTPMDTGYVSNHFYIVVGYDASTGLFEVVNPHNYTDSANESIVQWLNWSEIGRNFSYFAVGTV